jgi:hypothetical protein
MLSPPFIDAPNNLSLPSSLVPSSSILLVVPAYPWPGGISRNSKSKIQFVSLRRSAELCRDKKKSYDECTLKSEPSMLM